MKKKNFFVAPLLFVSGMAFAQTDSVSTSIKSDTSASNSFIEMNLEDLMDVKIVSASKKAESLFDAPLSASGITRDEIKKAGVTSIPEALRLVPGLIVREMTNGNYDVQIRGFSNLPPGTPLNQASNTTILVMIDNRPVYNYFSGGTFWETLPVDLNDVERIEVIRGPSAALYGPNAANGVINIITRRATKEGLYTVANAQGGTVGTYIGNASVGYKKGKLDFIVSGNYQTRNRAENNYYSWLNDKKISADSLQSYFPGGSLKDVNGNPNVSERYPSQSLAQGKYGYNGFVNYTVNDKVALGLNLGGQQSQSQIAYIENLATPLGYRTSATNYADLHAKVYGLTTQVAYQGGVQDVSKGFIGYKYGFTTLDALAEYDINFLKYFSVKPGVNYRSATYDDSKYVDVSQSQGFINGSRTLDNIAGSIRAEFDNKKAIKLIAAGRYDTYNHPSAGYLSYQFAGNFKINDKNLFRATYSRSFRGPTMYDIYNSQALFVGDQQANAGPLGTINYKLYANITGNKNLTLQKVDMFELGYRLKATDYLHFDLEAFYQVSSGYSQLVGTDTDIEADPRFLPFGVVVPTKATTIQRVQNIRMKAEQTGFTLGSNFTFKKIQFKPFVTIQQTFVTDIPKGRDSADVNIDTRYDGSNSNTPTYFGGATLNYQPISKLNLNMSCYYYGKYTYTNIYTNFSSRQGAGIVDISDKYLVNAKVSYKVIERLDVFINARNAFGAKAQEFANTDITQGIYMVGASFEY